MSDMTIGSNRPPQSATASVSVSARDGVCVPNPTDGSQFCGTLNTFTFQRRPGESTARQLNVLFVDTKRKMIFLNGDGQTFNTENVLSYVRDGQHRSLSLDDMGQPPGEDADGLRADGITVQQFDPATPHTGIYTPFTPDAQNNPVRGESGTYRDAPEGTALN